MTNFYYILLTRKKSIEKYNSLMYRILQVPSSQPIYEMPSYSKLFDN